MKQTSIDAYNVITANHLIKGIRFEVFEAVFRHGPITINQADKLITHRKYNAVSPRFSELEDLGVIAVVGQMKDPDTGHECNLYQVTGALPSKPGERYEKLTKKCSKCEHRKQNTLLAAKVKRLEMQIAELQAEDKAEEQQRLW